MAEESKTDKGDGGEGEGWVEPAGESRPINQQEERPEDAFRKTRTTWTTRISG